MAHSLKLCQASSYPVWSAKITIKCPSVGSAERCKGTECWWKGWKLGHRHQNLHSRFDKTCVHWLVAFEPLLYCKVFKVQFGENWHTLAVWVYASYILTISPTTLFKWSNRIHPSSKCQNLSHLCLAENWARTPQSVGLICLPISTGQMFCGWLIGPAFFVTFVLFLFL